MSEKEANEIYNPQPSQRESGYTDSHIILMTVIYTVCAFLTHTELFLHPLTPIYMEGTETMQEYIAAVASHIPLSGTGKCEYDQKREKKRKNTLIKITTNIREKGVHGGWAVRGLLLCLHMVLEPFMASTTQSLLMSTEYLRPIERAFRACTLSGISRRRRG